MDFVFVFVFVHSHLFLGSTKEQRKVAAILVKNFPVVPTSEHLATRVAGGEDFVRQADTTVRVLNSFKDLLFETIASFLATSAAV